MRTIKSGGFTMIEVLVALLILSISLLGMAGLQLLSLQTSGSSLSRSQATILAYDLAERMRRNPEQMNFYVANLNQAQASPNCLATGCGTEELAREDIIEWQNELQNISGQAMIQQDINEITLQLSWSESQYGAGQMNQSYDMTFEL
ncbi:type IV pilus modification protein PilV [Endozoicomonas ascidiicola]|uniref:type IV pilus modification protein PilV n=1 Tax=Endozoicomonas ascidiicola TaxID=1698521 RepID=UPI000833E41F|nr:type IV pilus modification protein PilV [Endozoicomonas ascidiicola]